MARGKVENDFLVEELEDVIEKYSASEKEIGEPAFSVIVFIYVVLIAVASKFSFNK